jgi:hypothetical protein
MIKPPLHRAILPVVAVLAALSSARAAVIASDTFITGGVGNYTAGVKLDGQNPTSSTGFTGAWFGSNSSSVTASATNLGVSGVTNTGGSVNFSLNGAFSREEARSFTSVSGVSTLWFGGILQANAGGLSNGTETMYAFLSGALPTSSAANSTGAVWSSTNGVGLSGFAVGQKNGKFTVDYQSNASGSGVFNQTISATSFTADTPYFIVSSLTLNTSGNNDTLNIWLLTSAPSSESSLGTATFTLTTADIATGSDNFNTLSIWAARNTTGSVSNNLDALRIGTTYLDVVPEPSTASLAAIAFIFGIFVLRKRSANRCVVQ